MSANKLSKHIVVIPYNPDWPKIFEAESQNLLKDSASFEKKNSMFTGYNLVLRPYLILGLHLSKRQDNIQCS